MNSNMKKPHRPNPNLARILPTSRAWKMPYDLNFTTLKHWRNGDKEPPSKYDTKSVKRFRNFVDKFKTFVGFHELEDFETARNE